VIVVDYVMRVALADQSLDLKIANEVGTTLLVSGSMQNIPDLDFAVDIMLISDNSINSRKLLD
jgi:hypothetical protein